MNAKNLYFNSIKTKSIQDDNLNTYQFWTGLMMTGNYISVPMHDSEKEHAIFYFYAVPTGFISDQYVTLNISYNHQSKSYSNNIWICNENIGSLKLSTKINLIDFVNLLGDEMIHRGFKAIKLNTFEIYHRR